MEQIKGYALRVWQYKQGEMVSLMIHLGDRLGMYGAMAGEGPMSAAELAERTHLDERWVTEWLRGQAAAQLVSLTHDGLFELPLAGTMVLAAEEASPFFAAGAFDHRLDRARVDRIAEGFRSGRGFGYSGADLASAGARMSGPSHRHVLVGLALPQMTGVVDRLAAGGRVLDMGCGSGVAVRVLAEAFPEALVFGVDTSADAIEVARRDLPTNATVEVGTAEDVEGTFDLIVALDSLHDMPRPDLALAAAHRAMAADGSMLVKDIKCGPEFEDNLRNPVLAMLYGFSVASCLPSGLATEDGLGLGTVGLHPGLLRELASAAGFGSVRVLEVDDPTNLYYELA